MNNIFAIRNAEINRLYNEENLSVRDLAIKFGLSMQTISLVLGVDKKGNKRKRNKERVEQLPNGLKGVCVSNLATRFILRKYYRGYLYHFGSYRSKEDRDYAIERLESIGWRKENIKRIYKELKYGNID